MKEIWKTYYKSKNVIWEVSNLGKVKRNGEIYVCKINPYNNYLHFGGHYLHRALAELFIENPDNKKCVDHIDTNRQNNNLNNLRWVSYKENCNNPISRINLSRSLKNIGLNHKGENNPMFGKYLNKESKDIIGKKQSISWNNKTKEEKQKVLEARSKSFGKRIWINNGIKTKWVKIEDLNQYKGYKLGRI